MSENNYGALMMKSSLSPSIDIDDILIPGIYPIQPGNQSSPDIDGGILTISPGATTLRTFTSKSTILSVSTLDNTTFKWSDWSFPIPRNSLSSGDGLKWVGKCHSVNALRETEPTYDGQAITLARTSASGPLVNAVLTYDASDSTTADDGYSVFVTRNGARWKADVSNGVDIRLHENFRTDGGTFGSVVNDIIVKEVKKMVSARSFLVANTRINIPAKLVFGGADFLALDLDEDIIASSLFSITFAGNTRIHHPRAYGRAISVNNYPFYTDHGLDGWEIDLKTHDHKGGIFSLSGEVEFTGVSNDGITSTAAGLFLGNEKGNEENTGILNVRGFRVEGVKFSNFKYGLDLTVKSTYLNNITNCSFVYNYYGISNTIRDVANGGEGVRFVKVIVANNISHGVYWDAVGAGVIWDSCHFDYNGGHSICMGYAGRGNRFIFTNQCWFEGWGKGCFVYNAEDSGVWAEGRSNSIFFEAGTYMLARDSSPITERSPSPIFKNRGNIADYIYDNGIVVEFKDKSASKFQSLVEPGSQNRIVYTRQHAVAFPLPCVTSYKHTLNFGLYNFSGTPGANLKGATDAGTRMLFSTINNDAALTIVYGNTDTSDASTFTQAQEVNINSTSTDARFVIQNANVRVPLNNPDEKVYGGITLNPAGITSGEMFVTLRLQIYRATDLSTQLGIVYGGDVKVPDYSTSGGDGSGLISLQCSASVPASAVAAYGGSIVVVPALSFVGAQGSYKIRLPAFWKE
ncbi:TPA: hypothetical protein L8N18_004263 [Klebsiella pneumoniae]|nr:hypothetical protein [Klebsiella pneumoniae]